MFVTSQAVQRPVTIVRAHLRPLDDIGSEIASIAADLSSGTARFLALLAEFDRRGGWTALGIRSCADWLSWRCGLSPTSARDHVRVARALTSLPRIAQALERGELSYSKVRALTRIATPATEQDLLNRAVEATAAHLERVVRRMRAARARDDAEVRRRRRSLRFFHDEDGCLVIQSRLEPEEGEVVLRAIQAAVEALESEGRAPAESAPAESAPAESAPAESAPAESAPAESAPAESAPAESAPAESSLDRDDPLDPDASPPWERQRADALCLVAESFLATGPRAKQDRALVVIHVDDGALSGDATTGDGTTRAGTTRAGDHPRADLAGGPPLAPETARRFACDARVMRVVSPEFGTAPGIGRRSRIVPRAMRRALQTRDQGCRFPACTALRHVDAHHIRHWARGGETSLENLLMLCRWHHRLVHEGGFTVVLGDSGALEFRRPDGVPVDGPG